jgi:protein gp37
MERALHRQYRWAVPDNIWYGTSVTCNGDEKRCLSLPVIDGGKAFISFEPLLGPIDPKYSARGLIAAADWIIIGAQTNPTRLPDPAWVQEIIDAARGVGAAVFMKDSLAPLGLPMLREFPEVGGATCTSF